MSVKSKRRISKLLFQGNEARQIIRKNKVFLPKANILSQSFSQNVKHHCSYLKKKRYRGVILIFQIFRWLLIHNFQICSAITLPEKCLYSEFFWSVFHRIQTEYGPEKLQIRTIRFTPNLIEDWNLWSQNLNTGKTVKNYFYVLIQTHQCFCFLLPTIASSFNLFLHCFCFPVTTLAHWLIFPIAMPVVFVLPRLGCNAPFFRSNRLQRFLKMGVHKYFTRFTGKHRPGGLQIY